MPTGDREPALRQAAQRQLSALDALQASAPPGDDPSASSHAKRVAVRRTGLRRLTELAARHGVILPAAVAARASRSSRESRAMHNKLDALTNAVTTSLQQAIADGVPVVEAIEAGMSAVVALSIEHEGQFKAGARLVLVGEQIVESSPEQMAKRSCPTS